MARQLSIAVVSGVAAGAAVSVPIFVATARQTDEIAQRQEILENLRFVREQASDGGIRQFQALELSGAPLGGLALGCQDRRKRRLCANFEDADLAGADLSLADLSGATMYSADLTNSSLNNANLTHASLVGAQLVDANLFEANLTDATLVGANLTGARLSKADLSNADFRLAKLLAADLSGATLTGAHLAPTCYDSRTTWPEDFEPPPADCSVRSVPARPPR